MSTHTRGLITLILGLLVSYVALFLLHDTMSVVPFIFLGLPLSFAGAYFFLFGRD